MKDSLASKNLQETYDEKNYLKLMKGPFYNMISKEGSHEDDFANCTTQDLIDSANSELMKILLIGKPRCGKTTLAKALAEKLDLVRISPEVWIEDLLARIKDRQENPPEEDEEEVKEDDAEPADDDEEVKLDEDGNPIPKAPKQEAMEEPGVPKRDKKDLWLTDLEYDVRNKLWEGQCLNEDDLDDILRLMVNSPAAQTKGFIVDLTFSRLEDIERWGLRLLEKEILVEHNEVTHIIELLAEDEEVKRRARKILITPQNGKPYSEWERKERNKPKPKKLDENGEEIEEEEEPDENEEELIAMGLKGPLVETEMVSRSCDEPTNFSAELESYNMRERNIFDEYIVKLFESTYIKVEVAGMNPTELCEAVLIKMKPKESDPLRPIAHVIEDGAGAFKDLLTAGLGEDDAFFLPRQWSLWKTYDPVSLAKGQVE